MSNMPTLDELERAWIALDEQTPREVTRFGIPPAWIEPPPTRPDPVLQAGQSVTVTASAATPPG